MTTQSPAPAIPVPARGAGASLRDQLADRLAQAIGSRVLAPGTRLPSVREAARTHGVSTATVVSAYDRLQAHGLIEARPQRGFYVREVRPRAGLSAASERPPRDPAAGIPAPPVDATGLIRGMFHGGSSPLSPGMGTLPPDWLDAGLLQRVLRQTIARSPADAWLSYGEPAGDPELRRATARHLESLGIAASPAQILTSAGATHGLDIVSRSLLAPGDAVVVDEPGWAVEFSRLQRLGVRLLPVPRGPRGPDLAVLEALCREHRPRLYVTVSVLHNPTGASLHPAAAHRVLQIAEAHDLLIVEDDSYAWFDTAATIRLSALDGLRRTVLVSGWSKMLAPQWRVGTIAAPQALVERLVDTKLLGTLTTPALLEQSVARALDQGLIHRHAQRIVERLARAREASRRLAEAAGCRFDAEPNGLFGWVDTSVDTERLALAMHTQGWLVAPGSLFHAVRRPSTHMRINFACTQDSRFWRLFEGVRAQL